jgi:SAM-dependent methyltransferase|eukprot:jgi/Chrpa1/15080/Chrysochromulina_OHIO_Genome00019850-RA
MSNRTLAHARAAFNSHSWHGIQLVDEQVLQQALRSADRFDVLNDLVGFTGMQPNEILPRLRRQGRFHYAAEHAFWDPSSSRELAWYYRSSVDYLFGLAWHGVEPLLRGRAKHKHLRAEGPILEFSPGVANNGLYLAMNARVPYVYAGLSVLEASFAQYRAARRGLGPDRFRVLPPYDVSGDWKLDPLAAFKPSSPLHGKIGTILAFDVLEHVPHFERTVAAMVAALRPGGLLVEQSPFEEGDEAGVHEHNGTDTRLHTSRHGVTMAQAMGPTMKHVGGSVGTSGTHLWRKRGVDGEWKDTCCISGFWPDNCRGWQKRCNLK